jgi:hypothetical protein
MHSAPFFVFVDVCSFRQEESEKGLALEAAGLSDSKQTEVVGGSFLAERTRDLPLDCQVTKCSLGGVVVPRNTVIVNEAE